MISLKNIKIKDESKAQSDIEVLIVGVFKNTNLNNLLKVLTAADRNRVVSASKIESFAGKRGECLSVYGKNSIKRIFLYGLGNSKKISTDKLRSDAAKMFNSVNSKKISTLSILSSSFKLDKEGNLQALTEGFFLASYSFADYKSESKKISTVKTLEFIGNIDKKVASKAKAVAEGVSLSRDLGNHPANILTPTYLADKAKSLSKAKNMKVKIFDVADFLKMDLGSFYGVARGAKEPAKMIIVEYQGGKKNEKPIALVGKGLTFDSGGISIKPSPKMDEMKFDMCGAATVLGVMSAVAALKPKTNLIFAIGSTENMPGGDAQRPGDIVTAHNGKTIEVLNTDAEGRLVLADVLSYVNKNYNPKFMLDFATLTGAVIVALGHRASGIMGNDKTLISKIKKASDNTGEKVWELPLWEEYTEEIKGTYADIQNIGSAGAGTITAGAFLKEFVGNTPWCHFDIAGTAWGQAKPNYQPKFGATGVAVRLVYNLIEGNI